MSEDKKKLGVTDKKRSVSPLEDHDRITASIVVHHESLGENPVSVESRWWKLLETRAQPYERRLVVDETGCDMDFGFVDSPGLVVVQNRTGQGRQYNLSEQEQADLDRQLLLIEPGPWSVAPGSAHLGDVSNCSGVRLRSARGELRVTLTVFPR